MVQWRCNKEVQISPDFLFDRYLNYWYSYYVLEYKIGYESSKKFYKAAKENEDYLSTLVE